MAMWWWIVGWICCCCPCGDELRELGSSVVHFQSAFVYVLSTCTYVVSLKVSRGIHIVGMLTSEFVEKMVAATGTLFLVYFD